MTEVERPGLGMGGMPLTPDDSLELIAKRISTKAELDLAEARAILQVQKKYLNKKIHTSAVLDDLFVRQLHREMFGFIWQFAGKYRTRNLNLGIDFALVAEAVRNLVDDARLWVQDSSLTPHIVAVKFHHQLVSIHPFVNGNGRHSRFMADLLMHSQGLDPLTWGKRLSRNQGAGRVEYIQALRAADSGALESLVEFATS